MLVVTKGLVDRMGVTLKGRRREDLPLDRFHDDIQPGDYWKISNRTSENSQNLTGTCWYVAAPMGDVEGYALGRLENHTVREEEDGTISVRPGDGSSNSILITGHNNYSWHGYIEHGVWDEC